MIYLFVVKGPVLANHASSLSLLILPLALVSVLTPRYTVYVEMSEAFFLYTIACCLATTLTARPPSKPRLDRYAYLN